MKVKDGFILREIAGSYVIVPVGENLVDFSAMMTVNETGAFIWKMLCNGAQRDEIIDAVCAEYDAPREEITADVDEFLAALADKKVLN